MFQKVVNFILFLLLAGLPFYLGYNLYYLDKEYFLCPIEYRQDTIIIRHDSYGNGEFLAPRNGARQHRGIDLQAKIGTPVYAVREGKVIDCGFHKGMGNYVELLHKGGYISVYGHLSRLGVRSSQLVRQGQKIGEVGKTGNANFRGLIPHLHFEIKLNESILNPMDFLQ